MSNPFNHSNENNGALSNRQLLNLLNHLAEVETATRSPEQPPPSQLNSVQMLRAPPREEPAEVATTSFSSDCNSVLNQLIQQINRDEEIRNAIMQTLQAPTREQEAAESATTTLSSYCNSVLNELIQQRHRDEEIGRIHHDIDPPHMFLRRFRHQSGIDATVQRLQLRLQRELGITAIGRNDNIGHALLNNLGYRMEGLCESVNLQSAWRQYILGSVPARIPSPPLLSANRSIASPDVPVSTGPLLSTSTPATSEPMGADQAVIASPWHRLQVSSRNTITTESLLTLTGRSGDPILYPVPWTQPTSAFQVVTPRAEQVRSLQLGTRPTSGVKSADIPSETISNVSVPRRNDDDDDKGEMPKHKKRKYEHESFPQKLHRSITDMEAHGRNDIVSFLPGTKGGFKVHQPEVFVTQVMPGYFRCTTWASFRRQLFSYGFPFQKDGNNSTDKVFRNPLFIRGRPDLCAHIQRNNNNNKI